MKILYFSWLREKVGKDEELVSPPENVTNIKELISWLKTLDNKYENAFKDLSTVRQAKNMETVPLDEKISVNDEIAFFPPMTGG